SPGLAIGLADVSQATAGPTGAAAWTLDASEEWGAVTIALAPAGTGKTILLVTPNAASLVAQDAAKKTLMESWGYTVVPITASDTQANFDAAVATSDAVYISEEVTSGDVGTKLRDATIGVVNEEDALENEFGFSSANTNYTDSAIDITDNTHYITSPFSMGSLTITTAAQGFHYVSGTIASGLEVLAEQLATANGSLVVLEVGAALHDAGTAAGRRVYLPWGDSTSDIYSLNGDGQFLLRRAIEWATGAGAADSTAPTPDAMTWAINPDEVDTTSIDMTADTATDPSTPVKYLFTLDNTDCGADAGTGGDSSLWQTLTSYTDTGLQVNQCYGYTVTAQDSVPNTGTASSRLKAYTAANDPGTPVVSSPTSTSLTVDNAPNSNPAITTFAIAVDDDGDVSIFNVTKYVQADGTIGASAVWQTEATWGAKVVTGLSASTLYRFKVKARNGDNDETAFSAVATGTTSAPPSADLQQLHYRWRNDDGGEGVSPWYNSAWSYRKKITVDFTKVDANQTDFPVYINLADLGAEFFTHVQSATGGDGGDIRVTQSDGVTELPREIVAIDTLAQTGELHFEANFLDSTVNTDFYIYYGNAAASEPLASSLYGSDEVWANGYVGVWHLHNDFLDSSFPNNNGTNSGSTNTGGKIGEGSDFLPSNTAGIDVLDSPTLDLNSTVTVSVWFNPRVAPPATTYQRLVAK
ncbi:MAG: fibronectin type III domain-containing protein, partial [Acidimicrobiia bacterium]